MFKNDNGSIVPIRYADKKRIQKWLNVNRVQFPLRSSIMDSINSIPNQAENVNTELSIDLDRRYLEAVERGDTETAQKNTTDTVTYDDNGNVIPLSERFNTN